MIAMTTSSSIRVKARERACRMKSPLLGRNPGIRSSNAMKTRVCRGPGGSPRHGVLLPWPGPSELDDHPPPAGRPPPGLPGLPFFAPPAMAGPLLVGIPAAAGGPDDVSEDSPQPGSHGAKASIPPIAFAWKFRLFMATPVG